MYSMINNLKTTGSLLTKKSNRKLTVLTEEKLDAIHAGHETSHTKSFSTTSSGDKRFENVCTRGHKILTTETV